MINRITQINPNKQNTVLLPLIKSETYPLESALYLLVVQLRAFVNCS